MSQIDKVDDALAVTTAWRCLESWFARINLLQSQLNSAVEWDDSCSNQLIEPRWNEASSNILDFFTEFQRHKTRMSEAIELIETDVLSRDSVSRFVLFQSFRFLRSLCDLFIPGYRLGNDPGVQKLAKALNSSSALGSQVRQALILTQDVCIELNLPSCLREIRERLSLEQCSLQAALNATAEADRVDWEAEFRFDDADLQAAQLPEVKPDFAGCHWADLYEYFWNGGLRIERGWRDYLPAIREYCKKSVNVKKFKEDESKKPSVTELEVKSIRQGYKKQLIKFGHSK